MNKIYALTISSIISTSALATNNIDNTTMDNTQDSDNNRTKFENILEDKDMSRLHQEMVQGALSEVGMEARRKMIISARGNAYHQAMEK